MNEQTTLFLGPEENLTVLKAIFSSRKTFAEEIAKVIGKNKGTVLNAVHDLRVLCLIDEKLNPLDEAKNIVYDRGSKEVLKNLFISVSGNKEAVDEINSEKNFNPLIVGNIFCFHTNARASKESSKKQIGRLYLRWLKYLGLIENKEEEQEDGS